MVRVILAAEQPVRRTMTEESKPRDDEAPAPTRHADAERVTDAQRGGDADPEQIAERNREEAGSTDADEQ
jgi:hypothetical protein